VNEEKAEMGAEAHSREVAIAERFVALADTLVADYDVVELLEELVRSCVELLGVDHGGLLLKDQRGALQLMASSSEATRVVEMLQLQAEDGPCVECVRTGLPVSVHDLTVDDGRWPAFAAAVASAGFVSVHALPMRLRDETIGGLNLFTETGHALDPNELRIAQALTDVATIGVLQQRSVSRASLVAEQLQVALNSRIVIEQAKGFLAVQGDLDAGEAFEQLRTYARSNNRRVSDVAADVIRGEVSSEAIIGARRGAE
jgi:transcriptional regulator with GAF, ATPase, and Fis domain